MQKQKFKGSLKELSGQIGGAKNGSLIPKD
jgi:hypothetical protein